ncbi:MAG: hypothetical protein KC621_02360 [Myxococcales bacterium]|nr:hypothetical protein [Myxococcales bacterium]
MSTTLALVVVLVFSFAADRALRWLRRWLVLPTSGVHVLVGLAVGPVGLGIVNDRILATLQPMLSLVLGLVGFGMGLMLRRQLSRSRGLEGGLVSALIVVGAVTAACYGALVVLLGIYDPWAALVPALALGSVAGVSDAHLVGLLADRAGARGPVRELLHTFAVSSGNIAVSVLGLTLALARARQSELDLTPAEWLAAAVGAGVACGILFTLFVGRWGNDQRAFLATVAIITFASGIAVGMGVSPLLAGMIAGLTASLVSSQADAVGEALQRIEAPALVAIVVLASAMWTAPPLLAWGVVAVCLGVRVAALRLGAWVAPRLFSRLPRAHRLGAALIPQGALGVAIAANFSQVFPSHASLTLTVGLLGLLVSDLVGYPTVRRVLADAGEIAHRASEPAT